MCSSCLDLSAMCGAELSLSHVRLLCCDVFLSCLRCRILVSAFWLVPLPRDAAVPSQPFAFAACMRGVFVTAGLLLLLSPLCACEGSRCRREQWPIRMQAASEDARCDPACCPLPFPCCPPLCAVSSLVVAAACVFPASAEECRRFLPAPAAVGRHHGRGADSGRMRAQHSSVSDWHAHRSRVACRPRPTARSLAARRSTLLWRCVSPRQNNMPCLICIRWSHSGMCQM